MDALKGYFIVILYAVYLSPVSSDYDRSTDTSTIVQSLAIVGGKGLLPCNITLPGSDHPPTLIIWYKNEGGDPVYSYDLRGTRSESSRHWSDDLVLGSRANFKIQFTNSRRRRPDSRADSLLPPKKSLGKSFLLLRNVLRQDQGIYRCRVDFHSAPTRNSRVNLTVIVPPSNPVIVNESGREVTQFLGPYTEGVSVRVSCEVSGGRPKPSIFWSENGKFLQADSEVSSGSIVTSTVLLHSLQRSNNGNIIACSASNNNISLPTKTSVKLLMNLAPTAVWIHKKETHLSAGKETYFRCSSRGSSPRTAFTWLIGERVLEKEIKMNNYTSVLQYTPKVQDHDQTLICRSENPDLEKSSIQDTLGLLIHYKPIVKLKYGSNLNTSNMRVGDDVYFECHVSSRPIYTRISWYHNGTLLSQNPAWGTIMSNLSLVLQNIRRSAFGYYSCMALNSEGTTMSNKLRLDVKYTPVCVQKDTTVYGVAILDTLELTCDVRAHPTDLAFHWRFNSSLALTGDLRSFESNGTRSILSYTPSGPEDYGTILCFANNAVGRQREACVYHVIPAGPPDRVTNCTQVNRSIDNIYVHCTPGFDGGLEQLFTMELYIYGSHTLVRNLTLTSPKFSVLHLPSATIFEAVIFASNGKGPSIFNRIKVSTLKGPSEKRLATISSGSGKTNSGDELGTPEKELISRSVPITIFGAETIFIIVISIISILSTFLAVVGIVCRVRCRHITSSSSSPEGTLVDNGIEIEDCRRMDSERQVSGYSHVSSNPSSAGINFEHESSEDLQLLPTFRHGSNTFMDKSKGEDILPLDPAQLSHSCSFVYPSSIGTTCESIDNMSCNSNEHLIHQQSNPRVLQTFPRPSVSLSNEHHYDHVHGYRSGIPSFYDSKQSNTLSKGSTKNVTFCGEVETIQCSSESSSQSIVDSNSNQNDHSASSGMRATGSSSSSSSNSNKNGNNRDEDYCESRV